MRKQIAAANWKMNLTIQQADELMDNLLAGNEKLAANQMAIYAVPFPYLMNVHSLLKNKENMFVCAQNCSSFIEGAYTGEVSTGMLKSIGVSYCVIGHSERRQYFHETNDILAKKVTRALSSGVNPIFCCGEAIEVREAGTQNRYVETQLAESLFHLNGEQIQNFIIAYEPIWAIGTGLTASSDQAQEMHAHIRQVMENKYGKPVAQTISILYGGSVKANNAKEIFSKPDVDGGLVGGASLNATEFNSIIKSLN